MIFFFPITSLLQNFIIIKREIRFLGAKKSALLFHGRYATILYFLDNVEEGGETAFPIADNTTFDKEVGL